MKKHIGFIIGNLDGNGGTERVSTMLANRFAEHGYQVSFISPRSRGNVFFHLHKDIHTYCLGKVYNLLQYFRLWHRFYLIIRFIIKWRKIDVLIDVDMGTAMFSSPAIKGTQCKEITWDHFNYTVNATDKARQKGLKAALQTSSRMVLLTKADREMYIRNFSNTPASFFEQIYNPLTFDINMATPHSEKRVIAVGRLTPQKGFDYLLNIWQKIEEKHKDWILEIVGGGEEEMSLKTMVKDKSLTHVVFTPPTNDIRSKLTASSIYVLPSRYEGFPMVLLEATAMSLPIVAFDCPTGPSEIVVNDRNGFLVPTFDETLFANKLDALISDPKLRYNMGLESFKISRQFTFDNIFEQWERIISEI